MFLVPLGLQSRIVKWPFATIAIVVVTCFITIREFPQTTTYGEDVQRILASSQIFQTRRNLLIDSCHTRWSEDECRFVKERLQIATFTDITPFMNEYQTRFPSKKPLELREMNYWVLNEDLLRTIHSATVRTSLIFEDFERATHQFREQVLEKAKNENILVRGNARFLPALKALVLHEGWLHLFGNMFILVMFSLYLEQRVGTLALGVMYVVGGVGANLLQIPFLPMSMHLLGASGAVSTLIGAFAFYFWQEKIRCLFSVFFFYNRIIMIPAWLYIGFFLLANDVIGLLSTGTRVAHLAHLGGFALGYIMAAFENDFFPLKKGFLFPQEQKFYYMAKDASTIEEKMIFFQKIYQLNRESYYAFRGLFIYLSKQQFRLQSFSKENQAFIRALVQSVLRNHNRKKSAMTDELLSMVPLSWNLGELDLKLSPDDILQKADHFLNVGDYPQTLRYYDLFFEHFAAHAKAQEVQTQVIRIFDQIEGFELKVKTELLSTLMAYADHHPKTYFQAQVRRLVKLVQREEQNAAS